VHIPDGFVDVGTSAVTGVVAAGGLAVALRRSRDDLEDRAAPLAGLVAAFVFAVQMLNFPVAAGTSGHLLGGVLAAVLVGPWVGVLCVSVVLIVQALLFADGGLSALGLNITNMALVGCLGGWIVFVALRALLPASRAAVVGASAVAAWFGVLLASVAFTLEYATGGNDAASVGTVLAAMVGTHALVGLGEAAITAMTVSAVLATRPDLVHGARQPGAVRTARPAPAGVA
jgi:cobalt/nickel transport system permease protein